MLLILHIYIFPMGMADGWLYFALGLFFLNWINTSALKHASFSPGRYTKDDYYTNTLLTSATLLNFILMKLLGVVCKNEFSSFMCSHRDILCRNHMCVLNQHIVNSLYSYLCRRRPTLLSSLTAASCWCEAPFWGKHRCRWTAAQTPGCHQKSTLWKEEENITFYLPVLAQLLHTVQNKISCKTKHNMMSLKLHAPVHMNLAS